MRKTSPPPLKEYYAILGLPEKAGLEDVKKAYRQKAFELHPDLNPSAGASRQFQQLNEAYVVLIRLLDKPQAQTSAQTSGRTSAGPSRQTAQEQSQASSKAAHQAYEEQSRREQAQRDAERREKQERELKERQEAERRAREHQEREDKAKREEERRRRLREEIERQENERLQRREQARQEKERQAKLREEARLRQEELKQEREREPKPEAYRRTYAKPGATESASHASTATDSYISDDENGREALLNDLLNDPFARRVYEDIYSEVQSRRNVQAEVPEKIQAQPENSGNPIGEFTKTVGDNLKGWMRSQIDEEQIIQYPASKLIPGTRIRLQIRHGFSREQKTIEVTLPPDFVVGKPIRLRGMGKKLGKWQGDLYLRFQTK